MKSIINNILLGSFLFFMTNCSRVQNEPTATNHMPAVPLSTAPQPFNLPAGKMQTSYVCFVNNTYMGKEQIPVEVEGKIYYGCCDGCVDKLKNNRQIRYAIDPYTGNEVDKATAFIVAKPGGNGEVFYLASESNYNKYTNSQP